MERVGMFHITEDVNATQMFVLYPNKTIEWFGGGNPPLDVPVCGFDGELCIDNRFKLSEFIINFKQPLSEYPLG